MKELSQVITRPEWTWTSPTGDYSFSLSVIGNDILYGKSSGYVYGEDVIMAEKIIQQALDEYFPSGAPFYFISDLADATGSSTQARNEHLHYRMEQLEQANLFIYAGPNAFLKIVIKAGRLFSSQLREKVDIADDFDHAMSIIERHRKYVSKSDTLPVTDKQTAGDAYDFSSDFNPGVESDLPDDPDELKDLVIRLQTQKTDRQNIIRKKSEQLIRIMNEITWGDADKVQPVEFSESDDFAELFQAFNLLQLDLLEFKDREKKSRDALRRREKQYENVFNNIADIVFLHDKETHRFVAFNNRALKYGYSREELLNMTPFDLHPESDLKKVEKTIDEINDTPGTGNMWRHKNKDGSLVDVEIMTSDIEYNGRPTFVSIVRDITDRRRFEKALIKKQQEAEAASRSKSEFLANMSHEIRTPMNGVIGMLDILSETGLNEEQLQFAASAQQSADSLLVIINDILDFSKIEAGKLEIETIDFDLTVTLDSLSDLMGIKTFEKGVNFACLIENNVPILLRGDPSRLRQILTNLTGNALKFTENGEIFTKVSLDREYKDTVTLCFEVSDTGLGIPEEKLDTLFESFTQVDASTTRKYGGTGLGLAISKQLCELMGGHIGVKSLMGKGSTFYFTAVFEQQSKPVPHFQLVDEIAGKKILIVDDNPTNRRIFTEYLKSWDCIIDAADNGETALEKLKTCAEEKPFDIALIDMQMPGMSGIALGRLIKQDDRISKTLMVMLSSVADRGDADTLASEGFAGYLTKPIKKTRLFDTLRTVLSVNENREGEPGIITSYRVEEIKKSQSAVKDNLKILLVEDNLVNQKVAQKMLQPLTRSIVIADNGEKAIRHFLSHTFDVIFMDVQMPIMDGKEATRKIRDLEKKNSLSRTPVIALTANAMKGDREALIECGVDEYLTKPIKKKDLIEMLKTIKLI